MATKQYATVQCRCPNCLHGGIINKDVDEFVRIGKSNYYHSDCYKAMNTSQQVVDKQERELKTFKKVWYEKINKTTDPDELEKMLQGYLSRGVSSEQLLFTLTYVVGHRFSLHRPHGFTFYIDMVEIKDAYLRKKQQERIAIALKRSNDAASQIDDDTSTPVFSIISSSKKDKLSALFTGG